jgi:hypothetical protein
MSTYSPISFKISQHARAMRAAMATSHWGGREANVLGLGLAPGLPFEPEPSRARSLSPSYTLTSPLFAAARCDAMQSLGSSFSGNVTAFQTRTTPVGPRRGQLQVRTPCRMREWGSGEGAAAMFAPQGVYRWLKLVACCQGVKRAPLLNALASSLQVMAAGGKELRDRIDSVKNTQKITEAMKLVAAAKVRRAQTAVVNGRPFAENLVKVGAREGGCSQCAPGLRFGLGGDIGQ